MQKLIHDAAAAANFSDDKMKKVNLYESPHLFCDIYCLKPGQSQKAHAHDQNDKIYHALTGTCHVQLGDQIEPLPPGQVAIAPAGVIHGVENRSDSNATLLVVMAPNPNPS